MKKVLAFRPEQAPQEPGDNYVRVVLRDMEVDVCIGLYESEKGGRKQKILVNVELYADKRHYLKTASPKTIIDYARVIERVQDWAERGHTLLIETYARELLDLCFEIPGVEACRLSVLKTEVSRDAKGAGVELFMTRADYEAQEC